MSASTDQRWLAIQSLAAHPNLRGLLQRHALQIEAEGDKLVLKGIVPSYYYKQLLQEALRDLAGVACIKNLVEVVYSGDSLPSE